MPLDTATPEVAPNIPPQTPVVAVSPKPRNKWLRLVLELLLLVALIAGGLLYQPISDTLTIQNADPNMIALASASGMSRAGELVFLKADPTIVSGPTLIKDCTTSNVNNTGASVSGCYSQATGRIYLLDMPKALHGVEIVTAAYEMLHPVYIALDQGSGAQSLNNAIEANFAARKSDPTISGLVSSFAKSEPGQRDLELFSILGTQYTNLTPQLAAYYKPYFSNLQADVAINSQVNGLFKNYTTQLASLHSQIALTEQSAMADYDQSISWARQGSQSEDNYYYSLYTRLYRAANALVSQYNQLVQQNNLLIAAYTGGQPVSQASMPSQQGAE